MEPIPAQTLKEGTPTRVVLRNLKILNPGVSRKESKILPGMAKICGGSPSTV